MDKLTLEEELLNTQIKLEKTEKALKVAEEKLFAAEGIIEHLNSKPKVEVKAEEQVEEAQNTSLPLYHTNPAEYFAKGGI